MGIILNLVVNTRDAVEALSNNIKNWIMILVWLLAVNLSSNRQYEAGHWLCFTGEQLGRCSNAL